jgi:hypothetical protein
LITDDERWNLATEFIIGTTRTRDPRLDLDEYVSLVMFVQQAAMTVTR